jgi:intracellular septation protein A
MQLFVDFIPIIIFFIAYKLYGMYVATAAIMGLEG